MAVYSTLLVITSQRAWARVLDKRGYALESVVARICREAGGRVATNVLVRELDLVGVPAADGRRLEVVVDGLPLHAGGQLAVDTTLDGALRGDGSARSAKSRLVVLGVEVGRRWSVETSGFVGGTQAQERDS